eukprot:g912.t1
MSKRQRTEASSRRSTDYMKVLSSYVTDLVEQNAKNEYLDHYIRAARESIAQFASDEACSELLVLRPGDAAAALERASDGAESGKRQRSAGQIFVVHCPAGTKVKAVSFSGGGTRLGLQIHSSDPALPLDVFFVPKDGSPIAGKDAASGKLIVGASGEVEETDRDNTSLRLRAQLVLPSHYTVYDRASAVEVPKVAPVMLPRLQFWQGEHNVPFKKVSIAQRKRM